jgi:Domain of unknown function (DUF6968)
MYRLVCELLVLAGLCVAVGRRVSAPPDELSWLLGLVIAGVGWLLRALGSADDGSGKAPPPERRPAAPTSRALPEPPFAPVPPTFELTDEVGGRSFLFNQRKAPPREVHVRVGRPIPGDDGRWICPYQIQGLGPQRPQAAFGPDSLGALLMALHTIPIEIEGAAEVESGFVTFRGSRRLGFGSVCAVLGRRRRRRRGEIGSVVVSSPRPPIRSNPVETV